MKNYSPPVRKSTSIKEKPQKTHTFLVAVSNYSFAINLEIISERSHRASLCDGQQSYGCD